MMPRTPPPVPGVAVNVLFRSATVTIQDWCDGLGSGRATSMQGERKQQSDRRRASGHARGLENDAARAS